MIERDPADTVARRVRLRATARELRRRPTDTESLLWEALRRRQVGDPTFRRQHPIGPYVVDFVCQTAGLVVEVDGPIHESDREYDAARDEYLQQLGYRVLRIPADRVTNDLHGVIQEIKRTCSPPPLPRTGEGVGGRGRPGTLADGLADGRGRPVSSSATDCGLSTQQGTRRSDA